MESDHVINEGEADARSFVRPSALSIDAMKSIEDTGQLFFRHADAGISDGEHGLARVFEHADRDAAVPGEFEGVGDQVENDLLPKVMIDEDGRRQQLAADVERDASP